MSALAAAKKIFRMGTPTEPMAPSIDVPIKANAIVFVGGVCAVDATGYGIAGSALAGLYCAGLAAVGPGVPQKYDATGLASGVLKAKVEQGTFAFAVGSAGDALTQADFLKTVYLIDDQTVGRLDGGATPRPIAGVFMGFAPNGVSALVYMAAQTNAALLAAKVAIAAGTTLDTIGAPGAISVLTDVTLASVDGTDAYTLANGIYIGQRKRVVVVAGVNTPVATITPATPRGFATITALGAVGDCCELEWTATGWIIVSNAGVTVT